MLVISIQSQVVTGHVGNSAAVYPMQAEGVTVAAVPTTLLSNHPRYPTTRGRVLDADLVADLLLGVEERGLIEQAAVLITGYLGSPAIASCRFCGAGARAKRDGLVKASWPLRRRLIKRWAAPMAVIMVLAMFAVANKTVWGLGPEWCARYMLAKYMLHMEDGSCSSAAIEPPITGVQPSSQAPF